MRAAPSVPSRNRLTLHALGPCEAISSRGRASRLASTDSERTTTRLYEFASNADTRDASPARLRYSVSTAERPLPPTAAIPHSSATTVRRLRRDRGGRRRTSLLPASTCRCRCPTSVPAAWPRGGTQRSQAKLGSRSPWKKSYMDRDSIGWKGDWVAAPTPFTVQGILDENALRSVLRLYHDQGVHGVLINGTTGEWFSQTEAERRRVAEVAVEELGGKIPVVVGCTTFTPSQTIALGLHAREIGADGMLSTPPPTSHRHPARLSHSSRRSLTASICRSWYTIGRTGLPSRLPGRPRSSW